MFPSLVSAQNPLVYSGPADTGNFVFFSQVDFASGPFYPVTPKDPVEPETAKLQGRRCWNLGCSSWEGPGIEICSVTKMSPGVILLIKILDVWVEE